MNVKFENIVQKYSTGTIGLFVLVIFLAIPLSVIAVEELQWQPASEANYPDILEFAELRTKANYEEISSWQGRINILATRHYYGAQASKLPMIDTNSLAGITKHICIIDKIFADFAVDMPNNKLYSNVEPNELIKAVDLDINVPLAKNVGYPSRTITILTPDKWSHYEPAYKYSPKFHKGRASKMVIIDAAQDVKGLNGDIQDPRNFFNSGGEEKKLWETLSQIRKSFLENGNVLISGYPHIEISSIKTENGVKYRIITTWKGGENYVTKYIRSLLEIDEAVGFNVIKVEVINPDGVKLTSKQYTYEKFEDIFVPKTYRKEFQNNKGEVTGISEITIETTGLNKPLPEDTFSIKNLGVEEDTIVTDNIKKAEFRYSKGVLVPISEPNNP